MGVSGITGLLLGMVDMVRACPTITIYIILQLFRLVWDLMFIHVLWDVRYTINIGELQVSDVSYT